MTNQTAVADFPFALESTRPPGRVRERVAIWGVPVDRMGTQGTIARLTGFIEEQRAGRPGPARFLATVNADFVAQTMDNPELRRILAMADVVTADGMPIVWLSRKLGAAVPERVTGIDLIQSLVERAAARGWSVFFLGGGKGVAEEAAARLRERHPGFRVAGCYAPPYGHVAAMDNEAICARINEARPDILLVAFGCPKQETWIYANRHRLRVGVACGVGGSFDFIAGRVDRAPVWFQDHGLEWVWRAAREPRRLALRYAKDIRRFVPAAFRQLRMERRSGSVPALSWRFVPGGDRGPAVLELAGSLAGRPLEALRRELAGATADSDLVVDLAKLESVRADGVAALLDLWKEARDAGRAVALAGGEGGRVRRILEAQGVTTVIPAFPGVREASSWLASHRGRAPGYRLVQGGEGRWRLVLTGEVPPPLAEDLARVVIRRIGEDAHAARLTVETGGLDILDASVASALLKIKKALGACGESGESPSSRAAGEAPNIVWKLVGLDAWGRRVAAEVGL